MSNLHLCYGDGNNNRTRSTILFARCQWLTVEEGAQVCPDGRVILLKSNTPDCIYLHAWLIYVIQCIQGARRLKMFSTGDQTVKTTILQGIYVVHHILIFRPI